ncbi:Drug Metabolite transporter superfamily [Micractinium conductrix]|uniref:Drug Metabolite transporter superfamily n=1 Tax=Micractinium conductrix TaxID=554055 RepID=A0A2P6VH01_9CHLO|nr:Drug Metabolite transporter superfamily [Micractinium conductrix]|eukprot:PSC73348.1 Drug Metabolite transporter superfamily [Micractinium conductrix]
MWVPWRLERSPLAPAVPLEGSDTVEGLQALERRRLTEALSGGAAVGAAAAGRAGAAATGRRAFQRYRGPFIDQLSIEDLKAAPKSWALFWRGGERASAADAYSLPASLAVLHERTEENFVSFLPNYLRLAGAVLLATFYLRPKALLGAAAVAVSMYRSLGLALRRQQAEAAAGAAGSEGRGRQPPLAQQRAQQQQQQRTDPNESAVTAATTVVTWLLVAYTRCLPMLLLGATASLVAVLVHCALRRAPSESRHKGRQPLGYSWRQVLGRDPAPEGADPRALFREVAAALRAAVALRARYALALLRYRARTLAEAAASDSTASSEQGWRLRLAFIVFVYLGLNSTLNLLNKWALGVHGFRFPMLLTSCHMAATFLALAPIALREPWESHRRTVAHQWVGLCAIGACMSLNIVLNNVSLVGISLSLNQIIRSSLPVVVCVLGVVVEGKHPTRQELGALVVLTIGVMLAVWQGAVTGQPHAILACMSSVVCGAIYMTFISKLLSEKLDVVHLTFYTAPVSLACLTLPTLYFERHSFAEYLVGHWQDAFLIMSATSAAAVFYNLAHNKLIETTSAVTTTVLGEVKIVGLLVLSSLLLGEGKEFTPTMTAGCASALLGFALYSHAKILKLRSQETTPLIAVTAHANSALQPGRVAEARQFAAKASGDEGQAMLGGSTQLTSRSASTDRGFTKPP